MVHMRSNFIISKGALVAVSTLLAVSGWSAHGQGCVEAATTSTADTRSTNGQSVNDIMEMTPEKFQDWTKALTEKDKDAQGKPLEIENAVMRRLRAGRYVTDDAIIMVMTAWSRYESKEGRYVRDAAGHLFPDTKRVIDELMPFLSTRLSLKAKLHQQKAYLFRSDKDTANAKKEYEKAVEILTALHIDIDQQRIASIADMADMLYSSGDKKKAEALYLEALSYPFYKIRDPWGFQYLREIYRRAGRGLIKVRRGNLAALKLIIFIPSAGAELQSDLEQAIKEAQDSTALPDGT